MPHTISDRTIGRLSLYRRLLTGLLREGTRFIHSQELASLAGVTAAQVRRDIMNIGYSGNPNRGYDTAELVRSIGDFMDDPAGQQVALIGVGNLGRAMLAYFQGRRPRLSIVAAFDNDPAKCGRVIQGCRCYSMGELEDVVRRERITVGVITVPANEAQRVANRLVAAGVTGIINYAPVPLWAPVPVHVEDIDMTTSLEKAAYFARTMH